MHQTLQKNYFNLGIQADSLKQVDGMSASIKGTSDADADTENLNQPVLSPWMQRVLSGMSNRISTMLKPVSAVVSGSKIRWWRKEVPWQSRKSDVMKTGSNMLI